MIPAPTELEYKKVKRMNISDEAVEAAIRVLSMYIDERMSENDPNSKYTREGAIEILEAAAPYLMAQAWDNAMMTAESAAASAIATCPNPYRSAAVREEHVRGEAPKELFGTPDAD